MSTNKVIQVSDRRLTRPDGGLYDDEANKAICVSCLDSCFAIAYSGLGIIGSGKRTDEWLVDYLASINAGRLPLGSIIEKIKSYSSQTLKGLSYPPKYKALTFVLAGYGHVPFIAQISNIENERMENLKEVDDIFHSAAFWKSAGSNPKTASVLTVHGIEVAVTKFLSQRLRKQRRRILTKESKLAADDLVSTIRASTQTPSFGNYVGRNCMAVIVNPPDSDTTFEAYYYPDKAASQIYAPHVVFPGVTSKGIRLFIDEEPSP